jgi:hypothetical protein
VPEILTRSPGITVNWRSSGIDGAVGDELQAEASATAAASAKRLVTSLETTARGRRFGSWLCRTARRRGPAVARRSSYGVTVKGRSEMPVSRFMVPAWVNADSHL